MEAICIWVPVSEQDCVFPLRHETTSDLILDIAALDGGSMEILENSFSRLPTIASWFVDRLVEIRIVPNLPMEPSVHPLHDVL